MWGGVAVARTLARTRKLPMPSRVDALKSLALFASSRRKDLDVIARYLDEMSFVQGATLINQGQSNHTFFAIADGDASLSISGSRDGR
jgi:hypothetical protein